MTTTSTPFTSATVPLDSGLPVGEALRALQLGQCLLLPTESLWCVACDARQDLAVRRLRQLCPPTSLFPPEILFSNLAMLRAYTEQLHPRLETLLFYHQRPLTVLLDQPRYLPAGALLPDGRMAGRLTRDGYLRDLISRLGHPLCLLPARRDSYSLPDSFGRIRSDILQEADFVVRYRQRETLPEGISVMVALDAEHQLVFLRE